MANPAVIEATTSRSRNATYSPASAERAATVEVGTPIWRCWATRSVARPAYRSLNDRASKRCRAKLMAVWLSAIPANTATPPHWPSSKSSTASPIAAG